MDAPGGSLHQREQERAETPFWLEIFRPTQATARLLLRSGLPVLVALDGTAAQPRRPGLLLFGTEQDRQRAPQSLFEVVLPFLARQQDQLALPEPGRLPLGPPGPENELPKPEQSPVPDPSTQNPRAQQPVKKPPAVLATQPLVGVYHTHDWESFISEHPALQIKTDADLGRIRSLDPQKNILRVGEVMAERLAALGVATVQNPRSHEDAGYDSAYSASRKTAKQILGEHGSVRILLDIHRDAVPREMSTTQINGQEVARIQIVLGTGRDELPHPRWKENHAFAQVLHAAMERHYPGLSRGILLKQDRYNQDLMPGAVLLEVGSALNTAKEAEAAALLFAEVLRDVIAQNNYPR